MKPILEIKGISKKYRIENATQPYLSLRESILSFLKPSSRKEEFWALKDVSFDVMPGDTLGVIGKNGAGKSTLLKILSKITPPTSGKIISRGRIASLLEVGTGFHPELTGKENIFLNGSILGMKRTEIQKQFDAIVDFSGVEKFINTPLKHYSSGMQLRLAFAVSAFLEPEILIIDEVLAVGDAEFQKKCMGKMGDISKSGRTILFVSHNMGAIQNLCNKGLVLKEGQIVFSGSVDDSINSYVNSNSNSLPDLKDRKDRQGTGKIKINHVRVTNIKNEPVDIAYSGQDVNVVFEYETGNEILEEPMKDVIMSLQLKNNQGIPIFLHHNRIIKKKFDVTTNKGSFTAEIKRIPLPQSSYFISFSVIQNNVVIDMMDDVYKLEISDGNYFGLGENPPASHGVCFVEVDWSIKENHTHADLA